MSSVIDTEALLQTMQQDLGYISVDNQTNYISAVINCYAMMLQALSFETVLSSFHFIKEE